MTAALHVGTRVQTPDGPGTVVSFWEWFEGLRRRQDPIVELDGGQQWRKRYTARDLDLLEDEEADVEWPA